MTTKNVLSVLTAIGAVVLIIFLQQEYLGSATPAYGLEPKVTEGMENITLDPITHKPISAATVQPQPVNETQQLSVTSLLEDLKKKAVITNPIKQPGWYLFVVKATYDIDAPNNGILPDGVEIPKEYTLELWMYFDEQEKLTQLVSLGKTLAGDVFQAGVEIDGRGWNSATGDEEKSSDLFYNDMLTSVHKQALNFVELSPTTYDIEAYDDYRITTISVQENYQFPIKIEELNAEVVQLTSRYSFNEETGLTVKIETTALLVDGSERIIKIEDYFYLGIVSEPSEEALTYLEKVERR